MRLKRSLINHLLLSITALGLLLFSSCESTPPKFDDMPELPAQVTIKTEMTAGGEPIGLNETFTDQEGNNVQLVAFKFYLSDLQIQSDLGQIVELSEIELFDFKAFDPTISTPQWREFKNYTLDPGNYELLRFGLGVSPEMNAKDPSTFANENPLSVFSNMYWSWGSQYRFIILEAKVDTLGGDNFDHDVIFHTGLDDLYRSDLIFPINISPESADSAGIILQIDWNDLFYNHESIDLRKENITHTTDTEEDFDLARKMTDNFVKAISIED